MALLCEISLKKFLVVLPALRFVLFQVIESVLISLVMVILSISLLLLLMLSMSMRVNQENPFRFSTDKQLTLWQNETIAAFIHELGLVPIALVTPHIEDMIRQEWYFQFEHMRDDPDMYSNSSYFLQKCVEHWRHWRKERNAAIKHHAQFGQSGFLDELPQRTLFDEY